MGIWTKDTCLQLLAPSYPPKDYSSLLGEAQMAEAIQDVYGCLDRKSTAKAPDRLCSWMMHSAVAKIKRVAGTLRKSVRGS